MATNLVSLITQFLTPDMITRIASMLGIDRNSAQTAIGAAVPGLLAAFAGAAEQPSGAQNLVAGIKQQSGMLDSLTSMIGGGGQSSLVDQGSSLLRSVLGGQDQAALAGAVSKFAGIGSGAGSSLLAMLTPIAMGAIGKQLGGGNLNASSLTGLLASQKSEIAQALPGGFDRMLSGSGLLESVSGMAGAASAMGGRAAQAAGERVSQVSASTAQAVSDARRQGAPAWIYWALPLILAAGVIWYLLADRGFDAVTQAPSPAIPSVTVGGIDIGKQLGDSVNTLRTSLQGVTDAASARAALPRVQAATAQVEKVNGMLGQLSADQRKTIAGFTAPAMASLNALFDKVLAIPGVGEVLRPSAEALKTRLADLSNQSTTIGSGRAQ